MKRRTHFLLLLLLAGSFSAVRAQQQTLSGTIHDENGAAVQFASAALLKPSDSTLLNFAMSDAQGVFTLKNVMAGKYLLQISFVGYDPLDTLLTFPVAADDLGIFIMHTKVTGLNTVKVTGERIPIQLNGDTLEYNAGAFKTQPDASAEDLLKQLPGVEVDKSGNVKAEGEAVQQVLVDGKEFFSSDPTVATKNLPADAIDKVQVYDKTSDESDFTGVDDGTRTKTINLMLKENKKKMWLGDAQAGAGTEGTYMANAKAYRFTAANQFAALGMFNDINQYGFNIRDYIDFNGGMGSLMQNGGLHISTGGEGEVPLNFGQQQNGLITSGAGGLNYTHEKDKNNRINISYLGNGYQKDLVQNSTTQNFTNDYSFDQSEEEDQLTTNYYHHLDLNFRAAPDSLQRIFGSGALTLSDGRQSDTTRTGTSMLDSLINMLNGNTYSSDYALKGTLNASYLHRLQGAWKYIKLGASFSGNGTLTKSEWDNITQYFDPLVIDYDNQSLHTQNNLFDYSATLSASRILKGNYYMEPSVTGGYTNELLNRTERDLLGEDVVIDSLSPHFTRSDFRVSPSLALRYSTQKTQWRIAFAGEGITLHNAADAETGSGKMFTYFTPQLSFEKEFRPGRHLRLGYNTSINAPTATQLLPVTNYNDPLLLYIGNPDLKPEYENTLYASYVLFDQFSFTSLFTNLHFTYTKDKINYATVIHPDFSQSITPVNVPFDYTADASVNFSTPVRPLFINVHLGLSENFDRSINYVNDDRNTINSFTHGIDASIDNRNKQKLDAELGGSLDFTQSDYSVSGNGSGNYFSGSWYASIDYNPVSVWHFSANANVSRYTVQGIDGATVIPSLGLEITRYLLASNRASITLRGFDLLDKNAGVEQTAAYNYLRLQHSNTIGRYIMLSLKYRINKEDVDKGMQVHVRNH